MVNILEYINGNGEVLQINQKEVHTEQGQQRIREHMGDIYAQHDTIVNGQTEGEALEG